jgi:arginyl-tRNA synthetase
MLAEVREEIITAIAKAARLAPHEIAELLEEPKNPELGDLAFPCFRLSAKFKTAPQNIAKDIAAKLPKLKYIKKIQVAGPYINFFLSSSNLAESVLTEVYKAKADFGAGVKKQEKVMIEGFGVPNTHKVFHIGHLRNTCLSDSLIKIEKFYGHPVIAANYIGDIGTHVAKWLWFYTKFYKGKIPRKDIGKWLGKIYAEAAKKYESHEKYHEEVSEVLKKLEAKDKKLLKLWKETRKLSLSAFAEIYKTLGVKPDVTFYESEVEKSGKKIVSELVKKGLAKKDQGAMIIDLKKYGLDIFLLLKSDGSSLYSTKELALAKLKFEKYKINKAIYITGQEQIHYFKQLFKTLELMGFKQASKCYHLAHGLVLLHGKKMASRAGDLVSFEDLFKQARENALEEVWSRNQKMHEATAERIAEKIALAALKYSMLKQSSEKTIDFDFERALAFEGDTGPYLQYSLVRAKKILQKVKARPRLDVDFTLLKTEEESNLAKQISNFKEIVAKAAEQYAPNIIANYAYELTQVFNTFYEKCPVAKSDAKTKAARVLLVWAFAQVLKNALNLLGIEEVEVM